MSAVDREACPHCREAVALEASLCPHCRQSVLVDVLLARALPDARARYQMARTLTSSGASGQSFAELQRALAQPEALLGTGLTRAAAQRLVDGAAAAGEACRLRPTSMTATSVRVAPTRPPWVAALAAGLLVLATLGLVRWLRPTVVPVAPTPLATARPVSAPVALTPRQIAARTLPGTASLRCADSVGAGFFVTDELLLTNDHVVCSAGGALEVVLHDGRRQPGTVMRRDARLDLALVRAAGAGATPLPLGDAGLLAVGDRVLAIGSPVGLEFSVNEGLVSNLDQVLFGTAYVQTDARINPGNSGGPLLDSAGRVVGVVSLKHGSAEGIAWALPINYAWASAQPLIDNPRPGQSSEGFEALLARAERANREVQHEIFALDARPRLVRVGEGIDQRLQVRVLMPARTDPGPTDVKVNVWSGDQVACTLDGRIDTWTLIERKTGDPTQERYWKWLESNGLDLRIFAGDTALAWQFCPHDTLARQGAQLELVGGDPTAERLRVR